MADEKVVTWVLGAGFSRSLGGPLLGNLFGRFRLIDLEAHYPEKDFRKLHTDLIRMVPDLFERGGAIDLWNGPHGPDPEMFLDYLDLAATTEPPAGSPADEMHARLAHIIDLAKVSHHDLLDPQLKESGPRAVAALLHGAARRLMAAECMAFLERPATGLEVWQPYWDWLRLVTVNDWIITFNYDLLVETLQAEAATQEITTVAPHILKPEADTPWPKVANVLKLHGSVDWKRTAESYSLTNDRHFALTCDDQEIGIASPGSNKLRESKGGLANLWKHASKALQNSDAIVFLGYRFPPTDAHARRTFVNALAKGAESKRHVSAHVVLKENSLDVGRTSQILHYAFKRGGRQNLPPPRGIGYQVIAQPLSVEDFLTVMSREQLFNPNPDYQTEQRWARGEAEEQTEIDKLQGG